MIMSNQPAVFVLVHGAWHGGWCWHHVARQLRAQGHAVYTPTQTGLGARHHLLSDAITLDTFVDDIGNLLLWEDLHDVMLVGHSFGGLSISGVADRMPERIRHLVWLDAFILQHNQSTMSTLPDKVVNKLRSLAQASESGVGLPAPSAAALGVTDPDQASWVEQLCTPHPISTYENTLQLQHPVGNGLPSTYIAVTPEYMPTSSSRDFARTQPNWRYLTLQAGHDAMVTAPNDVSRLLLDLV